MLAKNQNKNKNKSKKQLLLACFLVFLLAISIFSNAKNVLAAPGINKKINFQGKVVNTDGTNVSNASYSFLFCIYTTASPATPCTAGANNDAIWRETKNLTVTDGIFQTGLGDTTALPGSVDFNTDNIFLGVNFNGNGQMTPLIQFTASPYAFNADKLDGNDWTAPGAIGSATPNSGAFTTLNSNGDTELASIAGSILNLGNTTGAGTINTGGTSSWTNTSGNLSISTANSGLLSLVSAGALTLTAPTGIDLNVGAAGSIDAFNIASDGTLDFYNNETQNIRIENADGSVLAPSCDATTLGRMYYDTSSGSAFVCIESAPATYGWFDYTATSVQSNKVVTVGTGGDYTSISAGAGYLNALGGGILLLTPETHNVTSVVDLENINLIGANTADTRINITGGGRLKVKETQFKSMTIYVDSNITANNGIDAKYSASTTSSIIFEWVDFNINGTKVLIDSSDATAPMIRTRFISVSTTAGTQKIFLPIASANLNSSSTHFVESQGGSGTLDIEDWNVKIAGSSNVKTTGTIETIPDSTLFVYPGMNLQGAIDSIPGGGVITILPGTHTITSPISILNNDIQIEGYGDASVIQASGFTGGDTVAAIQIGAMDGSAPNDGVVLRDFKLEVSGTGGSDIHGIRVAGGEDNQIQNITLLKTSGASGTAAGARVGIFLIDGTAEKLIRPVVKGCRVLGSSGSGAYFTDGIHVTGGAGYGAGSGIWTNGQGIEGALIEGNYVDYVRETVAVFIGVNNSSLFNNRFSRMGAGGGGAFGIFMGNSSNVNMASNVVATSLSTASTGIAIEALNAGALRQFTDSVFSTNTVDGSANSGVGFATGVSIGNANNTGFHRNVFTNNVINGASNATTTAIIVTGNADDNNFSNNIINGVNNSWDTGMNFASSASEKNFIGENAFVNTTVNVTDAGTGTQLGMAQHNATTNPTVNDDSAGGYQIGAVWVNSSTQNAYILTNATVGSAVWEQIDATGGASGTLQNAYDNDADGGNVNLAMSVADGSLVLQNTTGTQLQVTLGGATAPTVDLANILNTGAGQGAATTGVDGLQVDFANAGSTSIDNAGLRLNLTSNNNTAGTTLEGISIENITGQVNSTETALKIGTGWDTGISIVSGGMTITGGALAINNATGITSNQGTLIIDASGNVDVRDALNADSITTDTGGVSIASGQAYTGAGAVTLSSATATGLTIDSGTTGAINLGTSANAKTITIGNSTGATAINLNSGSGNVSINSSLVFSGATPSISASAANAPLIINANGSGTVSLAGTSTGNILFGGGSGSTGCTLDNSTGNFICSGSITSTTTTGQMGWWSRTGTTLSPATSGDAISTSGNISTTGTGTITSAGLITGTSGVSIASGQAYTGAGAVTLSSATGSNLTINSGTTGIINIGDDASAETINIGTGIASKALVIGSTDTTSATTIQSGSGNINLQSNGTATGNVQIGDGGTASATPDLLVLDNGSAEPTGTNGAMYYSTALNKMRCYENGAWKNCITTIADAQMIDVQLTNTSTTPANTSVLLGTVSITPTNATGDVYVYASVYTNSTNNANQTITAEIHSGTTCAGTLLDSKTGTLTSANASDGPTILTSALVVNPGASAQSYAVCARSTTNNGVTAGGTVVAMVINGGADVAEVYSTNDTSIEAGDVVAYDPTIIEAGMKKSTQPYDSQVFGVITTDPGLVIGSVNKVAVKALPVALAGRIPVKVNLENGSIKAGDYLTASSIPGVAMKATKSGSVIGQAMSSFDLNSGDSGKVLAFVKNTYFNGERLVEEDGSELTGANILQKLVTDKTQFNEATPVSEIVTDRVVAGLELVTPQIYADTIIAKNIKAEHIEGLEFIETGLQDAQLATENNSGEVRNIGTEVSSLKKAIELLNNKSTETTSVNFRSLELSGGLVVGGPAEFKGSAIFRSVAEFFDRVIFRNKVEFAQETIFNRDTAGYAIIKEGQDVVKVEFEKAYSNKPIVNASLSLQQIEDDELREASEDLLLTNDVKYIITNVTEKSFEIRISQKAFSDIPFAWQAISVKDPKTFSDKIDKEKKEDKKVDLSVSEENNSTETVSSDTPSIIVPAPNTDTTTIQVVDNNSNATEQSAVVAEDKTEIVADLSAQNINN